MIDEDPAKTGTRGTETPRWQSGGGTDSTAGKGQRHGANRHAGLPPTRRPWPQWLDPHGSSCQVVRRRRARRALMPPRPTSHRLKRRARRGWKGRCEIHARVDVDADIQGLVWAEGIGGSSWSVEEGERARTSLQRRKRPRVGEGVVSCGGNDDGPSQRYQLMSLRTTTAAGNGRTRERCDSCSACAYWS